MPLSSEEKVPDVVPVDITETRRLQMQDAVAPAHPSPEVRTSQSPPPPVAEKVTIADSTQAELKPLLPAMDGGWAAWSVLVATILVQAIPVGGLLFRQCLPCL
jgi:hypothetical protein